MFKRLRRAGGNESGFTLIELLIVIVILGILAGIVVFAVSGITNRGQNAACKADMNTVSVASEAYYAQNGAYATGFTQLVPGFLHAAPTDISYTAGTGTPAGPPTLAYLGACVGTT